MPIHVEKVDSAFIITDGKKPCTELVEVTDGIWKNSKLSVFLSVRDVKFSVRVASSQPANSYMA